MMKNFLNVSFVLAAIVSFSSCKHGDMKEEAFDRTQFLEHYSTQIIQPAFENLSLEAAAFETAANDYEQNPDVAHLQSMQDQWGALYSSWTKANSFNFGPAGAYGLRRALVEEIGLFPANTAEIEAKIDAANFNFDDYHRNTRGLLALEYLLFQHEDPAQTVAALTGNRLTYLKKVSLNVKDRAQAVNSEWKETYAQDFIAQNGTDIRSSASHLFNEWLTSYEQIKEMKLGVPLGLVASARSTSAPEKVEAYYSKQSLKYLRLHFETIIDLWYGKTSDGTNGPGWDDYLASVEGGDKLIENTEAQIKEVQAAFDALPADQTLAQMAEENNEALRSLFYKMHDLTRYLKADMSSLLSLTITYSSSDGD